jgi:hypothetical protein
MRDSYTHRVSRKSPSNGLCQSVVAALVHCTGERSHAQKHFFVQFFNADCRMCVDEQATEDSLSRACKCHGVSGSCSVKTCWKSLADLRVVSVTLLRSYYSAVEVTYRRPPKQKPGSAPGSTAEAGSASGGRGNEKRLVPMGNVRKQYSDDDLVFYTMSPDYCLPDASLGSVGTKDR